MKKQPRIQRLIHQYNTGGNQDPAFVEMFLGRLIEENGELRIKVQTNRVVENSVRARLDLFGSDVSKYIGRLTHLDDLQKEVMLDHLKQMPQRYYPK